MIKVAVLDDYQNVFEQIIDTDKFKDKFEFKIFNEVFKNENESIVMLEEFEALFIMRERTLITSSLINSLPNLKYIMTSSMRNNAIDLNAAKNKNIIVCGHCRDVFGRWRDTGTWLPFFHHLVEDAALHSIDIPTIGSLLSGTTTMLLHGLFGLLSGIAAVSVMALVTRFRG